MEANVFHVFPLACALRQGCRVRCSVSYSHVAYDSLNSGRKYPSSSISKMQFVNDQSAATCVDYILYCFYVRFIRRFATSSIKYERAGVAVVTNACFLLSISYTCFVSPKITDTFLNLPIIILCEINAENSTS